MPQNGGGYELKDAAFTSGSGPATNGAYRMTATFGPTVPVAATNGGYSLTGGFASLYLVQTPGAPLLKIARSGAGVVLSWPAASTGFRLQSATTLTAPAWAEVPLPVVPTNGQNTVTVASATGSVRVYRLIQP